jgi:tight adherence protein B
MGAVVGLLFGIGLLLCWQACAHPHPRRSSSRVGSARRRGQELLNQAGYPSVSPVQLLAACLTVALFTFVLGYALSSSVPIAAAFALLLASTPVALVRRRALARAKELRHHWPDAVDNLASAIRAGLSLPEAFGQLAQRGPEPLRGAFRHFGTTYEATGEFGVALDQLKEELADPVADRIAESLRVARDVGGSDLGRLLRTLSLFLRDDARTRAELEARQSWTVNAARLALAAPWLLLALMSLHHGAISAYNTPAGVLVLALGGGVSSTAYRLMLRLGRLPRERRVLR